MRFQTSGSKSLSGFLRVRKQHQHPRRHSDVRAGFTLMEVLLVLALLVALSVLSWPVLKGSFAAQRLRYAADQLHADLARARATAIRTGQAQQLQIDGTASQYAIQPLNDLAVQHIAAPTAPSGGEPQNLPEGVTLLRVEAYDDVSPTPLIAASPASSTVLQQAAGSSTVFFHPNGTTSSARFMLTNESGMFLQVELRGLTGIVATGELQMAEAPP